MQNHIHSWKLLMAPNLQKKNTENAIFLEKGRGEMFNRYTYIHPKRACKTFMSPITIYRKKKLEHSQK